jgi:nucleoside-diphosphate-sugar epimerase
MPENASLILITGASGWLGRGLVNALQNGLKGAPAYAASKPGRRLRALLLPGEDPRALTSLAPDIEIVHGDITVPESIRPFFRNAEGAVLYHCAGIIHPKRTAEYYRVNTKGSMNIWEAGEKARVRRAVFISSDSPCGCNPHTEHVFDELSPYSPNMRYGHSKMLMEQAVQRSAATGAMETVIIRSPWFYGPFQPPRQTEFFIMIRDGMGPLVGSGVNRRSMTYIDNLVQGCLLAADTPAAAGRTYWIADPRPYPMTEIIDTIEKVLIHDFNIPCRQKRLRLPSITADVAGLIDKILQAAGFYHTKIHVLYTMNKTMACTVAKAQQELGYHPLVELEEGMRRSIAWLMEQPSERKKLLKKG